jgi:ribosomal protein S18 acetylase RimI-like enzyme
MTDEQYRGYREHAEESYARQMAESGELSWEDAVEKAAADYARLLPKGLSTPDQYLYAAYDDSSQVGLLWLSLQTKSAGVEGFVYDVEVYPDFQRRGYGGQIMTAAESLVRDRGGLALALNVFGSNVGARSLYEQLGYETTSVQMRKRL